MLALYIIFSLLVGGVVGYSCAPYLLDNKDAINAFITIFTVFGGFLIGVITLTGDPSMIAKGSWRKAEAMRRHIQALLSRQRALFYLYIFVLSFLVISLLLIDKNHSIHSENPFKIWTTRITLFLAVFSFLLTLCLPLMIIDLQKERIEKEIASRRKNDNIEE